MNDKDNDNVFRNKPDNKKDELEYENSWKEKVEKAKAENMYSISDLAEDDKSYQSAYVRECKAFVKMLPELLQKAKGQYVAIRGEKVIDRDTDEIALAKRMESKYRAEFVLIEKVTEEQTVGYLESPEEELP
jgi:Family of unknown function (DUF5678)